MRDSKPMVDTNILVYAHNQDSPYFKQAKSVLAGLIDSGGFCLTPLILFEFFSVITNGRKIEAPLSPDTALCVIEDMLESQLINVIQSHDDLGFFQWLRNCGDSPKRYQIYDASIAYAMFQSEISELYTNNTKDFRKFDFIEAINPFESVSPRSLPLSPRSIPYAQQSIDEKDVAAVCSVLRSDWLTTGPNVDDFEQAVADYVGAKYGVAVSNGTAALHLACLATGIGPGDEGVTSPITFLASANAMVYCGATPRFADIDPRTYNISVPELENCITERTRVVIPVHFAGQSCPMQEIREVVVEKEKRFGHKIFIIEDASHALGSLYGGRRIGCCEYSDAAVFSFHPVKHITTGEGGMVVTHNRDLAEKVRKLRSHGMTKEPEDFVKGDLAFSTHHSSLITHHSPNPWYYEQTELGFNYRITDIQCALGRSQLRKLSWFRDKRRVIVDKYNEAFGSIQHLTIPFESPNCESNFHLYVLKITFDALGVSRIDMMNQLKADGIHTQVHYIPVHLQPYFQKQFATGIGDCPEAEKYYSQCLSLPLYPAMSNQDVEEVIEQMCRLVSSRR